MRFLSPLILAAACLSVLPQQAAFAQSIYEQAAKSPDWAEGRVQKIDLKEGKVTIKHLGMRNFLNQAGVIVLPAQDKKILEGMKQDQAIIFKTGQGADGRPVLLAFMPQV
ncbi:copper-binding protein [Massilia sp. W12]|uniref:copper-binding protein n=1 Tax=Massilia sp. W12 TaxID=3126507 RepID=UPI0030D32196